MDGVTTLIFLSFTMLVGSFISGLLPMALTLSEVKMRHITVIGAGLLIGTALAVIIPEGIHSLNSINNSNQDHLGTNDVENHDVHKRSVEENLPLSDEDLLFFVKTTTSTRVKRQQDIRTPENNRLSETELFRKIIKTEHEPHDEHQHANSHSGIGVSLVLGFIFMLVIDHLGGNYGHSHGGHQLVSDNQSVRNKITFSTTLGLVVHAAADGIALGAAASTQKTDVEMIVFFAIMLHKAPAAFGLVSFLLHEGLERVRVRRHLMTFALSAPAMALVTFVFLKSNIFTLPPEATGYCMLFSAGTFLYVSTVHVLPEIQSHNDNRQFSFTELISFIMGSILPVFLAIGHHH